MIYIRFGKLKIELSEWLKTKKKIYTISYKGLDKLTPLIYNNYTKKGVL